MIRSRAPLRVSFAGGGTDVPPYPEKNGGCVINSTINKYAYANLVETDDDRGITVESLDYDVVAKYETDSDLQYDGDLDLVKAVIKRVDKKENTSLIDEGLKIFMHSDAPPGSGLGSSSTVVVSLLGLFKNYVNAPWTDYEIAELAYQIERKDLGISGGWQDQFAATFGGFNFMEFLGDRNIVNPLKIPSASINELQYRFLLCYTGESRVSENIIDDQVDRYKEKKGKTQDALDKTKDIAIQMKNLLLQNNLEEFGKTLHTAWEHKKKFSNKITQPHITQMYETARDQGALGGKLLGAGGGGYLLLYCPFDRKHVIAEELEELGGQVVDFSFELKGLQTWEGEG